MLLESQNIFEQPEITGRQVHDVMDTNREQVFVY